MLNRHAKLANAMHPRSCTHHLRSTLLNWSLIPAEFTHVTEGYFAGIWGNVWSLMKHCGRIYFNTSEKCSYKWWNCQIKTTHNIVMCDAVQQTMYVSFLKLHNILYHIIRYVITVICVLFHSRVLAVYSGFYLRSNAIAKKINPSYFHGGCVVTSMFLLWH